MLSSRWPHTVRIERAVPGGAQDGATGVWTSSAVEPEVLYDDRGDLQMKPRTIMRGTDRDQQVRSEGDLFLADETDVISIPEGARVVVRDVDNVVILDGFVVSIGTLDGLLYVSRMVPR